jgi:AraC-like DNA-binding protein
MNDKNNPIAQRIASFQPIYDDGDLLVINNVEVLGAPQVVPFQRNVLALCTKGVLLGDFNDAPLMVRENQVFLCPIGSKLSDVSYTSDFQFFAIAMSNVLLQHYLRDYLENWNHFAYIDKITVLNMDTNEGIHFCGIIQDLVKILSAPVEDKVEARCRQQMLSFTIQMALIGLSCLLGKKAVVPIEKPLQNVLYFNKFINLLQHAEIKNNSVEYYASKLCISPKYLADICKKNSGMTPGQWIREYTVSDITHYLLHTDLSMKEISAKLGFSSTSFFGKYVKESLGYTPMEYRKKRK